MDNRKKITELARQFPILKNAPGIEDWNPAALDQWAITTASHGERHAVAFLLHVWNCHHAWNVRRFDVMDALSLWSADNRKPFLEWARAPYWL